MTYSLKNALLTLLKHSIYLCLFINSTTSSAQPSADKSFQSVVRAEAEGRARADDPAPMRRVRPAELERFTLSIADVLRGEVGVQVRSGGLSQSSAALLRGSSPQQIAVFLDGIPLNRGGLGSVDLSQLAVEAISNVEIYRGLPPISVDSDSLGGALLLESQPSPADKTAPARTNFTVGGGSFGIRRLGLGFHSFRSAANPEQPNKIDSLRTAINLTYQGAAGDFPYYFTSGFVYKQDALGETIRKNDYFDQVAIDLNISYRRNVWRLDFIVHGFFKWQGVAGIGDPGAQLGHPTLSTAWSNAAVRLSRTFFGGRLHLETQGYVMVPRTLYKSLEALPPTLSELLGLQGGANLLATLRLWRSSLLIARAEVRNEQQWSTDLCPAPRTDCAAAGGQASQRLRFSAALGLDLKLWSSRIFIRPGVQLLTYSSQLLPFDAVNQTAGNTTIDNNGTFFSPRLEGRIYVWAPRGIDKEGIFLRTSGGRLTRLPTFLELFGDRAFFRENLRLLPEAAWLVDGGIGLKLARHWLRFTAEINGFSRWVSNLIETVRDGPGLRARNFEQVVMSGAEIALSAALTNHVEVNLNYTFLDARDDTGIAGRGGNLLPGRSPHTVYLKGVIRPLQPLRIFYEYDYASTLYLDAANYQPRPPRGLHSAGAVFGPVTVKPDALTIELRFEIRNFLDTRLVEVPLPLTQDGRAARTALVDYADYPLPGRTFLTNLQLAF